MLEYFLPVIIALGIITSYEDFRIGKIRNTYIVFALIYAVVINAGVITFHAMVPSAIINYHYVIELFTNIIFVTVVSFLLWNFGGWTAGDAKLFIAYSALVPFTVYSRGYQEWTPAATMLLNIFIPALSVMLVVMFLRVKRMHLKGFLKPVLKEVFDPKKFVTGMIMLFAVIWLVQITLQYLGLGSNVMLLIFFTLVIVYTAGKKWGNKALIAFGSIAVIRFVVDDNVFTLQFLISFSLLIFIWLIVRSFFSESIMKLSMDVFSKDIPTEDLKPGMNLSQSIQYMGEVDEENVKKMIKNKEFKIIKYKKEIFVIKPKIPMEPGNFIDEDAEGISAMDIKKIRSIGIKTMKISQTIPFAPFIFLGVILTILAKGNILIVIMNLFS